MCLHEAATGLLTLYSPASSAVSGALFSKEAAALNRAVLPDWAEEDAPNATLCSVNNGISLSGCRRVVQGLRRALPSAPRSIYTSWT